ncbi:MAG: hypothetical protein ACM3U2_22510 [Deltaproteobacteria bacterium]
MRISTLFQTPPSKRASRELLAFAACGLAAFAVQFTSPDNLRAAEEEQAKAPAIVIRPANFDPADELAYTRERGELKSGSVANGKIWNQPAEDSRAAVSGEAPAPAEAAGPGAPVSAASGTFVPRMTYAEAYAQIPFSRTEYEANPSYRHDAALELMFGAMRPTYIARTTTPYFSRYPDMFRYRFPVFPYSASLGNGESNLNMWWRTSLIAY